MREYTVIINLKSNLYIGSGFGFGGLIDHVSIKDGEDLVYIPGSTIKGKFRSICEKIALTLGDGIYLNREGKICGGPQKELCKHDDLQDRCIICRLFGSPFSPGNLIFEDARLKEDKEEEIKILSKISRFRVDMQNEVRTNVKISRYRRISEPKHLFALENVSKSLKEFKGRIYAKEPLTPDEFTLLKYGAKAISHMGGQKARGLGRVEVRLEEENVSA